MHYRTVFALAGLLLLLLSHSLAAQTPSPRVPPDEMTQGQDFIKNAMYTIRLQINDFGKKLDKSISIGKPVPKDFPKHCKKTREVLLEQERSLKHYMNRQDWPAQPQLVAYLQALNRCRAVLGALQTTSGPGSGVDIEYDPAVNNLVQCESNYLQAVKQIQLGTQAETQLKAASSAITSQLKTIEDCGIDLANQAGCFQRQNTVRFDTLMNVGRRIEAQLSPYDLPRVAVLAGAYQANAYSLGALYYHADKHWLAAKECYAADTARCRAPADKSWLAAGGLRLRYDATTSTNYWGQR